MRPDPFGYYARKAAREAVIRASAPYRIDDQPALVPDFDTLDARLTSVGLGVSLEPSSDGSFSIFDLMTACPCGRVHPAMEA